MHGLWSHYKPLRAFQIRRWPTAFWSSYAKVAIAVLSKWALGRNRCWEHLSPSCEGKPKAPQRGFLWLCQLVCQCRFKTLHVRPSDPTWSSGYSGAELHQIYPLLPHFLPLPCLPPAPEAATPLSSCIFPWNFPLSSSSWHWAQHLTGTGLVPALPTPYMLQMWFMALDPVQGLFRIGTKVSL